MTTITAVVVRAPQIADLTHECRALSTAGSAEIRGSRHRLAVLALRVGGEGLARQVAADLAGLARTAALREVGGAAFHEATRANVVASWRPDTDEVRSIRSPQPWVGDPALEAAYYRRYYEEASRRIPAAIDVRRRWLAETAERVRRELSAALQGELRVTETLAASDRIEAALEALGLADRFEIDASFGGSSRLPSASIRARSTLLEAARRAAHAEWRRLGGWPLLCPEGPLDQGRPTQSRQAYYYLSSDVGRETWEPGWCVRPDDAPLVGLHPDVIAGGRDVNDTELIRIVREIGPRAWAAGAKLHARWQTDCRWGVWSISARAGAPDGMPAALVEAIRETHEALGYGAIVRRAEAEAARAVELGGLIARETGLVPAAAVDVAGRIPGPAPARPPMAASAIRRLVVEVERRHRAAEEARLREAVEAMDDAALAEAAGRRVPGRPYANLVYASALVQRLGGAETATRRLYGWDRGVHGRVAALAGRDPDTVAEDIAGCFLAEQRDAATARWAAELLGRPAVSARDLAQAEAIDWRRHPTYNPGRGEWWRDEPFGHGVYAAPRGRPDHTGHFAPDPPLYP